MKNSFILLTLSFLLISGSGCKNKSDSGGSTPTASYLTTTEIQGTASSSCLPAPTVLGAVYNTMSVKYALTIHTNETINYQLTFYDSSNCTIGTEAYDFTQFGTIAADGASSTISGASNFSITLANAVITPRNSSWAARLNSNCTYTSFALNTSKDVAGISCTSNDSSMDAISWPVSGTILYNSGILSSGTPHVLRINISNSDTYSVYKPGGAGYPATLTTDFTY